MFAAICIFLVDLEMDDLAEKYELEYVADEVSSADEVGLFRGISTRVSAFLADDILDWCDVDLSQESDCIC